MIRTKIPLISLVLCISLILSACGPQASTEEEPDLQGTLAAMYTEETAQAAMAAEPVAEQAPAEQPAEAPAAEAPAKPEYLQPGNPPEEVDRTLEDSKCNTTAWEKRATQGDNFLNGLYERPFTSQEMIYQPDLDITTVDFAPDDVFLYFTIRLFAMNSEGGGLQGLYAIEFDRTFAGRGDLLVTVKDPAFEWSNEGVVVYGDKNRDVGGPQPVIADAGFNGSGYDMTIAMEGDRVAWARVDPKDGNAVQFAISRALLDNPDGFAWGAWADNGLMDPAQFDYNDRMGPTLAGSPIKDKYYPVKDLYSLDNTCRLLYGSTDVVVIPGLCKIGAPPAKKGDGCTWRCTNPQGTDPVSCQRYQGQWVCD